MVPARDGMSVLDVCCGTGTHLGLYARPGARLAGVDRSPAMLALARAKLGPDADLRQEDAARTSFADHTFDLVTITLALHEMPPAVRVEVLSECRRVVRSEGSLIVIDYHNGPCPFPRGWLYKLFVLGMEMGAGREHFRNYRDFMAHRGLDGLVEGRGFTVKHRYVVPVGVAAVFHLQPDPA
jgi:ubiquinone/menaquinone biosynthesis C-methylase UbiE